MELRHLRYFVAVAEALHFRRAAARLRISQPALSRQIRQLEDDVGTALLHRNTAAVTLTDAGTVFLDEVRDILERIDMAVAEARDAAAGRGGRLTIGSLGALSASLLSPALSEFHARYPQVEVQLLDMSLGDQVDAIKAGTIQIAFLIDGDEDLDGEAFESLEVFESRITVALGRTHPRARQRRVSLADIADERFLCVSTTETDDGHARFIREILAARHIRPRPIKRMSSFESLVALVAGNHGVSLLLPIPALRGRDPLVFRPVKEQGEDLVVRLSAVWRNDGGSQLVGNFVEVLQSLRCA